MKKISTIMVSPIFCFGIALIVFAQTPRDKEQRLRLRSNESPAPGRRRYVSFLLATQFSP